MIDLKQADRETIVSEILANQAKYAQIQADIAHVATTLSAKRKKAQYTDVASREEVASQYAEAALAGEEMPQLLNDNYDAGASKLIIAGLEMKIFKLEQQAQIVRGEHRRALIALAECDAQELAKVHKEARDTYIQTMADIMAISSELDNYGLPTTAQLHPAMISGLNLPMLTSEINAGGAFVPMRSITSLVDAPLRARLGKYSERLKSAGISMRVGA